MKTKLTRVLSLLLAIVLVVGCLAPLVACKGNDDPGGQGGNNGGNGGGNNGGGNNGGGNNNTTTSTYTVTVSSRYGLPLKNVWVDILNENGENVADGTRRTDENGTYSCSLDNTKSYTIELGGVPDGYIVGNNSFTFDASGRADIKLTSAPIQEGSIHDVDMYQVGDVIHDFFITDVYGEEYLVSSVLEERQLLVLNFWYSGCGPCVNEFPYMLSAYESYNNTYGDVVEIFAINDNGESVNTIQNFQVPCTDAEGNTVLRSLPFPTFKAENNGFQTTGAVSKFYRMYNEETGTETTGWPVSVFIDRAGVICCIEVGGVPNDNVFINAFNHFNAADYKQKLVSSIADFTPIEKPNITPPSFDEIDDTLTGNYRDSGEKIQVSYRWDTNEYSWPFIIETVGDTTAVRPSNINKDNSYAILYADVYLEAGDALVFDFISSTQNSSLGVDSMIMIVDGKDIYTIQGADKFPADGESGVWNTCCTYVAKESKTYEVAFVYMKDYSGYSGKDGVYVRNLRVIDESEVDVETYIFRYAATDEDEFGVGFNEYVDIVLGSDGYYHVDTADGPILLAMLVDTYTQFDNKQTVFQRLYNNVDDYGEVIFTVNGVNVWKKMESYGNFAANSSLSGYIPVTEELATFLKRYVEMFAPMVGEVAMENTWLQLCCYYDAYGTNGKQLEDPIRGLAPFSAPEITLDEMITVTYNTIIIPRGYLYAYTPTEDGVFRITSYSSSTIIGWVFTSPDEASRILHTDSETSSDRLSPDLVFNGYKVVCPNCFKDVIYPRTYDENGKEIVITELPCDDPICVDPITGAPTVITDFSHQQEVVSVDYNNISMVVNLKAGVTYYIAVAFHDPNELGSLDFKMTSVGEGYKLFTQVSPGPFTYELGPDGSMGDTVAGGKKVRLCNKAVCPDCEEMAEKLGKPAGTKYYHVIESNGSLGSLVFADFHLATSVYASNSLKEVIEQGGFNFSGSPIKTDRDEEAITILETAMNKGIEALYDKWIFDDPSLTDADLDTRWLDYSMFEVMDGNTSTLEGYENSAELIATALEWKAYVEAASDEWLHEYFGDEYDEKWEYYQMDDIKKGIYHGQAQDYTAKMREYVAILLDEADHPERQGCIAVDAELAAILQLHMDRATFEDVENSWVKLCYYYQIFE